MLSRHSRHGLALLLAVLACAPALAEESPAQMVRAEVAKVLAIVKDPEIAPQERRARLTQRIAERFDFDGMSQSILTTHCVGYAFAGPQSVRPATKGFVARSSRTFVNSPG